MRAELGAPLVLLSAMLTGCTKPPAPEADLLLRGGTLIDGTGGAPRVADVAIRDGRITRIGELDGLPAVERIDATGLVVAPGFIDLHSHADLLLLAGRSERERLLAAKISQGVTTLIVGNCGLGAAPTDDRAAATLASVNGWMTPDGVEAGAMSTAEYLRRLELAGTPLNVGTLAPHGPLRISAMGLASGVADPSQLESMRTALAEALDAGAFGLSVGLIYPPGMYTPTEELIELARVVASRDRLFTAHVRGSSEMLIPATEELIEVARATGVHVHHSHLEAVGRRFWGEIPRVLELEDAARASGLRVSHDVFPYTRAATMMSAIFPPWALEGGVPRLLERLSDPSQREAIRRDVEHDVPAWPPWVPGGWPHNLVEAVGWDGILVASVESTQREPLVGRSLRAIAADAGVDPFDAVADLMLAERGRVGQLVEQISGEAGRLDELLRILEHPAAAVVSDAEDYGRGAPHPAHAGAFARALRLNREHGLMSLQALVRRMTSYPASLLGLEDRGVLREGASADVVLFDARSATDRATWEAPRLAAEGVPWVIINGVVAVRGGRYVGGLPGEVLRATATGGPD